MDCRGATFIITYDAQVDSRLIFWLPDFWMPKMH